MAYKNGGWNDSLIENLSNDTKSTNIALGNIYTTIKELKSKLFNEEKEKTEQDNKEEEREEKSRKKRTDALEKFKDNLLLINNEFGRVDGTFKHLSNNLLTTASQFGKDGKKFKNALNKLTDSYVDAAKKYADFGDVKAYKNKLKAINDVVVNFLKERQKFDLENIDKKYQMEVAQEKERFLEDKIRTKSFDEALYNQKIKILEENEDKLVEHEKRQKDIENSKFAIETRQKMIRSEKEQQNYRDGYKRTGTEYRELLSKFLEAKTANSTARNFAIGTSSTLQGTSKAISGIATGKANVEGLLSGASGFLNKLGPWGQAGGALVEILKTAYGEYSKVDKAASDYARTVGGGAAAQAMIKNSINSTVRALNEFGKVTYDTEEMIKLLGETSVNVGRDLSHLSQMDMRAIDNLKKMAIDGGVIVDYDTLGISMENVSKRINALYSSSSKHGVNAKAAVSMMTKNLAMSQKYTFAGGVKALERMAEKSTALKINMQMAETLANKVMTLEGAMSSSARLSVLGGSFSNQSNPLSMLYGGLQDPEMLFNKMLETTKGMAYFDRGKGMMDISAFNRERIRAAAEAYGIDSGEMMKAALNQGRLARVNSQIRGNIDSDTAEYIRNIASIDENGNAYIETHDANGEVIGKRNISDLTNNDKEMLRRESQLKEGKENGDMGDVVNNTRSIQDKLDDYVNLVKQWLIKPVLTIANWFTRENFVLPEDNDRAFASGGFISGPGTSTSDSINAKLSNGEFVVNANATKAHRGLLESINNEGNKYASGGIVRPSGNNMKFLTVLPRNNSFGVSSNINSDGNRITIEPINISGTIRLEMNGSNRNISADELLNNATFIRQLSNAIEKQVHIGYRRDESQFKFTR